MPRRRKTPSQDASPGSDSQGQSTRRDSSPASSTDQSPQLKSMTAIFPSLFPAEQPIQSAKAKVSLFSPNTQAAADTASSAKPFTIPVPRKPAQNIADAKPSAYPPGFEPKAPAQKPSPSANPASSTPATATSAVPQNTCQLTSLPQINSFCQAPELTLTSLTISLAPLTAQAISDLALSDLPLLQSLSLASTQLDASTMACLVRGRWPKLMSLDLSDNSLDRDAIQILGDRSPWPGLERLNLNSNQIEGGAMAQLIRSTWPNLQYLDLGLNEMDFLAVSQLVMGKWPQLKGLALGRHVAQDAIHILIKEATGNKIEWPGLEELDLSCNPLLDAGAMSKLIKGQWPWLHTLSLADCNLDASSMSKLSRGNWPQLKKLDLSSNVLDAAAVEGLLKYQKWRRLENLNLSENQLDLAAFKALVKARWSSLKHLDLSNNKLPAAIVEHLQIAEWPSLEVLNLSNNDISEADLPMFVAEKYSAAAANRSAPLGYLHFQHLQVLDVSKS